MPTTSAAPSATAALSPSVFHPRRPPTAGLWLHTTHSPRQLSRRGRLCCQVALTTEVPSSSASEADEAAAAEAKVRSRIRVTVPLKVYHVSKAPDLDLMGMEGTIKQFVGLWKGKSISANLPFKVEFLLPIDGQPKPVKVLVHLKEDEFEYLD